VRGSIRERGRISAIERYGLEAVIAATAAEIDGVARQGEEKIFKITNQSQKFPWRLAAS